MTKGARMPWDRWSSVVADWARETGRLLGTESELPILIADGDGPGTPRGMSPEEESLVWVLRQLVRRCERDRLLAAGGVPDDPRESPLETAGWQSLMHRMRRASRRSSLVRDASVRGEELVAGVELASLVGNVGRPIDVARSCAHGFESLMACWNQTVRRRFGMYFTPQPLVDYVVRGVDTVLRDVFAVPDGLASGGSPWRIIDPACGSGAFLLGVVDYVLRTGGGAAAADRSGLKNHWLAERLIGMDVLPACGLAVELLVGHALACPWSACCASPLEEVELSRATVMGDVSDRDLPRLRTSEGGSGVLPIIIGNPPWANFGRRNQGAWISQQLREYKLGLGEKKLNLDDDFVKFLRWAQYWIEQAGRGVVAMVTSNTYLAGLTHRRMRASLARTFDQIHILNLHGSLKRRQPTPTGRRDENVFPIRQGVCVGIFVNSGGAARPAGGRVSYGELWGSRDEKLRSLARADVADGSWTRFEPAGEVCSFVPRRDCSCGPYRDWPRLDEVFPRCVSGIQTKRDSLFVGFTRREVATRLCDFLRQAARGTLGDDVPHWLRVRAARVEFDASKIRPYMVAPWDTRWVYFEPKLLGRARHAAMENWDVARGMLVFVRQSNNAGQYDHFLVTNVLVSDRVFFNEHGTPFVAPLWLCDNGTRVPNLDPAVIQHVANQLGIPCRDGGDGLPSDFGSEDLFGWIYAIVHSSDYRSRFDEVLRVDFPRIPLPRERDAFAALAKLGRSLRELHLSVAAPVGADSAHASGAAGWDVEAEDRCPVANGCPRRTATGEVAIGSERVWPGPVDSAEWDFRIGGYRVLERWLKQRRTRGLTGEDHARFMRMANAARETRRCVERIDAWSARVLDNM